MKLSFIFSLILLSLANSACAESTEERKAAFSKKMASRLYQLIVEPQEVCAQADQADAAEYKTELALFTSTNARLMTLLKESSYYAPDGGDVDKTSSKVKGNRSSFSKNECGAVILLLRSFRDHPEGQKTIKEVEDALSK